MGLRLVLVAAQPLRTGYFHSFGGQMQNKNMSPVFKEQEAKPTKKALTCRTCSFCCDILSDAGIFCTIVWVQ